MCNSDKALIITPFYKPNIGGAETFSEDLAKALSKKYVVHVCTIKRDKSTIFAGMDWKQAFFLTIKLGWSLWKLKRKYKYEKVYALGLMSCFICIMWHIKFESIIFNIFSNRWISIILNHANKIFVEGITVESNLKSIGVKRIIKFQHWCDQSIFTWKDRTNKNMKVLFVGRPIQEKGKHIIQECEKLTQGIEYEYIENIPFNELPKHYQMADVVVVPSLYNETFCRVVVEAASCGCALVVSNKGSLPEQVEGFGKTIEPTPENFRDILQKLNDNRVSLERIKLNTLVYAKKHFTESNADCFLL